MRLLIEAGESAVGVDGGVIVPPSGQFDVAVVPAGQTPPAPTGVHVIAVQSW